MISRGQCVRLVDPPSTSLTKLRPASQVDFFWEFARAEVQNDSRHDWMYSRGLGPDLFARVRLGDKDGLDRFDRALVGSTVLSTRPEYLRPLSRLGLRWFYGELPRRELPKLRVPNRNIFKPTAPSRLLRDFATTLDCGALPLWPPVARNYRKILPRFDPLRMVGAPIVIGTYLRGQFTIVEGLTRLSVLCSRFSSGKALPPRVRLLIGAGLRSRSGPSTERTPTPSASPHAHRSPVIDRPLAPRRSLGQGAFQSVSRVGRVRRCPRSVGGLSDGSKRRSRPAKSTWHRRFR